MWILLLAACRSFAVIPYDPAWSVAASGPTDACAWRSDDYLVCSDPWTSGAGHVADEITEGTAGDFGAQGFQGIAVGFEAACTLVGESGSPVCWGAEDSPLVEGAPTSAVTAALSPESLVAGEGHACGLDADGTPWCWGDDTVGQATPPSDSSFDLLAAGSDHTCGLRGGDLTCWGGDLSEPPTYVVQGTTGIDEVATGDGITCLLSSERVWCSRSPVADESTDDYTWRPQGIDTLHGLAVGELGVCALDGDDRLVCDVAYEAATLSSERLARFTLSSSRAFGCGVTTAGDLDCFGTDDQVHLEVWDDG